MIATERGFVREHPDGSLQPLAELWSSARIRMNDGGCDPLGRFYCGTMAYDKRRGAGTLYRLDPDWTAWPVVTAARVSNGLSWSPDGSLAHDNDTPTRRISVFEWSPEGGLANRRTFVDGRLDAMIDIPVRYVTACTFGGPDLDRLRHHLPRSHRPPRRPTGRCALLCSGRGPRASGPALRRLTSTGAPPAAE